MPLEDHVPVLDDHTYDSLLAEMRSRISRYTPEWKPVWTDFNESDPGITMVQLFAWLSEMLLYRMNRVPELSYLKFLQLLGIELRAAEPARALEEERRLGYVAWTRARGLLVLVYDPARPSPFLREAFSDEELALLASERSEGLLGVLATAEARAPPRAGRRCRARSSSRRDRCRCGSANRCPRSRASS